MKQELPENAKRVYRGIIFDAYQWEQKMFDGSKSTFERIKRSDTVTIIPIVGDKILIEEQEQPHRGLFISLPGGICEEGEDAENSAKRELLEETGYVSAELSFWQTIQPVASIFWNNHFFIARHCQKKQEPEPDNGEKITTKLVSFEEFILLAENDQFRHRDLVGFLYRLRLYPGEKERFRKLLFG